MTTENRIKGLPNDGRITALYCRLSVEDIEDEKEGDKAESNSIKNQKMILEDFCIKNPGLWRCSVLWKKDKSAPSS